MTPTTGRVVPWADWAEWREVGRWLFSRDPAECARGVARVAAWRVRGRLPLGADATAQLRAAQLADAGFPEEPEEREAARGENEARGACAPDAARPGAAAAGRETGPRGDGVPTGSLGVPRRPCATSRPAAVLPATESSLRCRFSVTLARLVSGVADQAQRGRVAASVASLAGRAGLPRSLVDVRHASAHGELPSLPELRVAARDALAWLRGNYWDAQRAKVWGAEGGAEADASPCPLWVLPGTGGAAVAEAVERLASLHLEEARRARGPPKGEGRAADAAEERGKGRGGAGAEARGAPGAGSTTPAEAKKERGRMKALKREAAAELARAVEGPAADRVVAAAALEGLAGALRGAWSGEGDASGDWGGDDAAEAGEEAVPASILFEALAASTPPPLPAAARMADAAAPGRPLPAAATTAGVGALRPPSAVPRWLSPSRLALVLEASVASLLRVSASLAADRRAFLPLAAEEAATCLRLVAEALAARGPEATVSRSLASRASAATVALAALARSVSDESAPEGSAAGKACRRKKGAQGGGTDAGGASASDVRQPDLEWRRALAGTCRGELRALAEGRAASPGRSPATRLASTLLDALAALLDPCATTRLGRSGGGAKRGGANAGKVGSGEGGPGASSLSLLLKRRRLELGGSSSGGGGECGERGEGERGASAEPLDFLAARLAALERLADSPAASESGSGESGGEEWGGEVASEAGEEGEEEEGDAGAFGDPASDEEGGEGAGASGDPLSDEEADGASRRRSTSLPRSGSDADRWRLAPVWRPAALGRLPDAVDPAGRLPDLDAPLPWRLAR